MRHADGIRQLDFTFIRQSGRYDIFRNVTSRISRTAVDFRRILSGECAAAMAP